MESARGGVKSDAARAVTGPTDQVQALASAPGAATVIELRPMFNYPGGTYNTGGCYDQSNIGGNTLSIEAGPCRVFWNVLISGWDPDGDGDPLLRNFQMRVDDRGMSSGKGGALSRCTNQPCASHAACGAAWGETTAGLQCNSGFCNSAWINKSTARADASMDRLRQGKEECDFFTWDVGLFSPVGPLFFASLNPDPCPMPDPQLPVYVGTYCTNVPADAAGTYTIPFVLGTETLATDPDSNLFAISTIEGILNVGVVCGDTRCTGNETPGTCSGDCLTFGDFADFQVCFGQLPSPHHCHVFDIDHSDSIDLLDYKHFADHNLTDP